MLADDECPCQHPHHKTKLGVSLQRYITAKILHISENSACKPSHATLQLIAVTLVEGKTKQTNKKKSTVNR